MKAKKTRHIAVEPLDVFEDTRSGAGLVIESEDGTTAYYRNAETGRRGRISIATLQRTRGRLSEHWANKCIAALAERDAGRRAKGVRR